MPTNNNINIQINGLAELQTKFTVLKRDLSKYMSDAADDAARSVILKPRGGDQPLYPPMTAANQAPTPYYIRGRGTQYKNVNDNKSQRLGTKFVVTKIGYGAVVGTNVTYAPYVIGEDQSSAMKNIGWKQLIEAAKESIGKITNVFQVWVDKALRNSKLK